MEARLIGKLSRARQTARHELKSEGDLKEGASHGEFAAFLDQGWSFVRREAVNPGQELFEEYVRWRAVLIRERQWERLPLRRANEHRVQRKADLVDRLSHNRELPRQQDQLRAKERRHPRISCEELPVDVPARSQRGQIVNDDAEIGLILFIFDRISQVQWLGRRRPPCESRNRHQSDRRLCRLGCVSIAGSRHDDGLLPGNAGRSGVGEAVVSGVAQGPGAANRPPDAPT